MIMLLNAETHVYQLCLCSCLKTFLFNFYSFIIIGDLSLKGAHWFRKVKGNSSVIDVPLFVQNVISQTSKLANFQAQLIFYTFKKLFFLERLTQSPLQMTCTGVLLRFVLYLLDSILTSLDFSLVVTVSCLLNTK